MRLCDNSPKPADESCCSKTRRLPVLPLRLTLRCSCAAIAFYTSLQRAVHAMTKGGLSSDLSLMSSQAQSFVLCHLAWKTARPCSTCALPPCYSFVIRSSSSCANCNVERARSRTVHTAARLESDEEQLSCLRNRTPWLSRSQSRSSLLFDVCVDIDHREECNKSLNKATRGGDLARTRHAGEANHESRRP